MKYDEAFKASLDYFNGDELAANVFLSKYALTDPDGDIKEATPESMHRRLAREFARIEANYPNPMSEDEIFSYLDRFRYIVPQGSPMSAIGNDYKLQSLGNCWVLPSPLDSYGGIMHTDQQLAQLMKRRGGCGIDLSNLRPKGLATSNAAGTTDGIGVFMERFSNTTREVAQSGRRGALMESISVHHPDIRTFIGIKKDKTKVTGANISIRITDEFMKAVKKGTKFELRWPVDSDDPMVKQKIDARELWHEIIEAAHHSAEPGLLFWDTIIKESPADCYPEFQTTSTNPCGEVPMGKDSCRLLLVNGLSFVMNPFTDEASFDFEFFAKNVYVAQRLMDDMVDLEVEQMDKIIAKIESDPEPDYIKQVEKDLWFMMRKSCLEGRRTGLGITAIGDTLAALGIRYGSDESIKIVEQIYQTLATSAYLSSADMAQERGAFPAFDYELEKDHPFINRVADAHPEFKDKWIKNGRRNIALLTTAPAGSVSVLTQTTSGIEPCFLTSYTRRKKINPSDKQAKVDFVDELGDKWQEFTVYHHGYQRWMDITGETDFEKSPYYQATSADIDWTARVKVQAAAQRWVDHAISSTVNIPEDTTVETTKDIYMTGWESGCKGVTIYREGSRSGVLVNDEAKKQTHEIPFTNAPKRPIELDCEVHHMTVLGEKWVMFVGLLNGRPYELMGGLSKYVSIPKRVNKGKIVKYNGTTSHPAEYNFHFDYEDDPDDETIVRDIGNSFENTAAAAFMRTISLALRHGAPVRYVVEQIQKGADKENDMFTFAKAASRVLKKYIEDGLEIKGTCADCGSTSLIYEEGCAKCVDCGSSKCG